MFRSTKPRFIFQSLETILLTGYVNSYINSQVANWQPTLGHKEQGIQVTVKLISRKNLVGNTAGNCQ